VAAPPPRDSGPEEGIALPGLGGRHALPRGLIGVEPPKREMLFAP